MDWKGWQERGGKEIGSRDEGGLGVGSQMMTGEHRRQCWNEEHGNGSQGLTHEPFSSDMDITEQDVELHVEVCTELTGVCLCLQLMAPWERLLRTVFRAQPLHGQGSKPTVICASLLKLVSFSGP